MKVIAIICHPDDMELTCGVKYAEGFTPALVSGRLRTYRLLP